MYVTVLITLTTLQKYLAAASCPFLKCGTAPHLGDRVKVLLKYKDWTKRHKVEFGCRLGSEIDL